MDTRRRACWRRRGCTWQGVDYRPATELDSVEFGNKDISEKRYRKFLRELRKLELNSEN